MLLAARGGGDFAVAVEPARPGGAGRASRTAPTQATGARNSPISIVADLPLRAVTASSPKCTTRAAATAQRVVITRSLSSGTRAGEKPTTASPMQAPARVTIFTDSCPSCVQ
ncbi:hypothetical protein GOHSU_04_01210 [Gordonia hirsuta DSM 44140 = NBRC 16056]|uniref:Uncharacterized protein n=1 Tax=Gordonia hirsuta DSM 44140 = NBRC 16056 TaxID=1121927 RepID=L7L874_9ACTN|nr:hypothetical protein GOHSU_04_01210 [Gordonia hirsuta DSM 44140 = NBRC 16056]